MFWVFREFRASHHKCHKVWHGTILNGLMPRVGFLFGTAQNTRPHCLKHVMDTLSPILLCIAIFNLYLLLFASRHPGLTLDGNQLFIGNYGPRLLLSKISILLVIPNVIWYKSNQHIDTTTRSFPPAAISLVVCLSYLSESSISNSASRAGNVFWPILVGLVLVSCLLHCLLSDDVLAPELSYSVVNVVTQNKPHMMCIIPRLVVCLVYNLVMQSQSSTLLLFS